jgi:hypothetical protein
MPKMFGYLMHHRLLNELVLAMTFERLSLGYDAARGFIKAQDAVAQHIDELAPTEEEAEIVRQEVLQNKRETLVHIEKFREAFPELISALETNIAGRVLLNRERAVIHDLLDSAVLDRPEAKRMIADVELRMASLQKLSPKLRRPDPARLITEASWSQGLHQSTVESLLSAASQEIYGVNDIIIRQGRAGGSLGIISRGTVEVSERRNGKEHVVNVLGPGALIGVRSLQSGINSQTVRAITPVAAIWLTASKLKPITANDETLAARIRQLVHNEAGGRGEAST